MQELLDFVQNNSTVENVFYKALTEKNNGKSYYTVPVQTEVDVWLALALMCLIRGPLSFLEADTIKDWTQTCDDHMVPVLCTALYIVQKEWDRRRAEWDTEE